MTTPPLMVTINRVTPYTFLHTFINFPSTIKKTKPLMMMMIPLISLQNATAQTTILILPLLITIITFLPSPIATSVINLHLKLKMKKMMKISQVQSDLPKTIPLMTA